MILVTGGTGLVGAHLLVQLTQEHKKVRAIHRKNSNLKTVKHIFSYYFDDIDLYFSKIEWIVADIIDIPSLEPVFVNITQVYHCAAIVSFHQKEYLKMRKTNIEGTANIVNFSIANKIEKLCFVSSIAAVGKSINNKEIEETDEWNVETSNYGYAITKHGAEMEVWRGTQEGLDAIIVNPGIILGSGYWHTSSGKIFSKIHKGMSLYTEGTTGYIDVKDVVKSMITLMKSTIKNERYILVAENKNFKTIFTEIATVFDKKAPSIKVSKIMSEIGWRIATVFATITGKEPILTKHSAKSIHNKNMFSNKKIKDAIDIDFKSISKTIKEVSTNFLNDKKL